MSITPDGALKILEDLGGLPATSFHEGLVSDYVLESLNRLGMEIRRDPYGNIIARIPGMTSGVPPIAFVAHMDHPGFEAIELRDDTLVAEARGGVPQASFADPVTSPIPVEVVARSGQRWKAQLTGVDGAPADRRVLVSLKEAADVQLPASIVFDLPDQASVHVEVYDLLGRRVTATAPKPMPAGLEQSISLRIPDLPSGTYFYRLIAVGRSADMEAAGELVVTR